MLEHGGRLRAAAKRWGIPLADWLDLSTGIAPHGYPVPTPSAYSWRCLPEEGDGLEEAASAYYGSTRLLALPGSQAAIMALPSLRPRGTTAILSPTYGEYAAAWQAAGHAVRFFVPDELENVAAACDAVIVANPNNPTGARFARAPLLEAARTLHVRGGKLIVDEAFADAEGEESLATIAGSHEAPNLVVLRSLGKFFGLAGARVGFAIGRSAVLERLAAAIGPWAVAHPAREAARAALADAAWQREQRERLRAASGRLERLLMDAGLGASSGTALFRYLVTPRAPEIAELLARQGVLVRSFTGPCALRFGLPGSEAEWERLAVVLGRSV
ncbi:MAG TPA: threonine-phosphate decarboxylase CobD [Rhodocyclaceae bacterium]